MIQDLEQLDRQAERYLESISQDPEEFQVSYAKAWTEREIEALPPDDGYMGTLHHRLRHLRSLPETPWLRNRRVLLTTATELEGVEHVEDPEAWEKPLPTWLSGLQELDRRVGGFMGVTVLSGKSGVGKSTLAMSSALEAALEGWRVVYFNAELDRATMRTYLRRYLPNPAERSRALARTAFFELKPSLTIRQCAMEAWSAVDREDERVLIVLDSLHTAARMARGVGLGDGYWREIQRWLFWALYCRRETLGDVAFLLVGELNRSGITKGETADFLGDLVLSVDKADTPGVRTIKVTKGRYVGEWDLGDFMLNPRIGRFEPAGLGDAA